MKCFISYTYMILKSRSYATCEYFFYYSTVKLPGFLDFLISVAVQSGVWYNLNIVADGLSIIMP